MQQGPNQNEHFVTNTDFRLSDILSITMQKLMKLMKPSCSHCCDCLIDMTASD